MSVTITTIPNLISDLASEVHMKWQWKHSASVFKRCFLLGYKAGRTIADCFKGFFCWFCTLPTLWLFLFFSDFKIFLLIWKEKEYIYIKSKKEYPEKMHADIRYPIGTLCWVYETQFRNLCSKLSCSRCDRASTSTGASHINRKEA